MAHMYASVGASVGIYGTTYSVSGSVSKGKVSANGTSYNESTVKADKNLDFTSGKDSSIKSSNVASEAGKADLATENNINPKLQ